MIRFSCWTVAVVLFCLSQAAYTQVYITSSFTPNNDGTVTATCSTSAQQDGVATPTYGLYAGFSSACTVTQTNGPIPQPQFSSADQSGCSDNGQPISGVGEGDFGVKTAQCAIKFTPVPGGEYVLESDHYIWLDGSGPGQHGPESGCYDDYDNYNEVANASPIDNLTMLTTDEIDPGPDTDSVCFPTDYAGPWWWVAPGVIEFAKTTAHYTAIQIAPSSESQANPGSSVVANFFQTQQESFIANGQLLVPSNQNTDQNGDQLQWCLLWSQGTCPGTPPSTECTAPLQGTLNGVQVLEGEAAVVVTTPLDGSGAFLAPDPIYPCNQAALSSPLGLGFPPSISPLPESLCVDDANNPNNNACASVNLEELYISLSPTEASMADGAQMRFTGTINTAEFSTSANPAASVTTGDLSWASATWTTGPWSGSGSAGTVTVCSPPACNPQTETSGSTTQQIVVYQAPQSDGTDHLSASIAAFTMPLGDTTTIPTEPDPTVINVGRALQSQSVTFGAIPSQVANATLSLSATASSGLAILFTSVTPGVCGVSNATALLSTSGTCTIIAQQPGNSTYAAASPVTQSFSVGLASQTISFPSIPNVSMGESVTLTATATSGLPVVYTSETVGVCTVTGVTVSVLTPGTCTIEAEQSGNATFATAASATQSFTVSLSGLQSGWNYGATPIGMSSTATVTVTFSAAETLGAINVVTQGLANLDYTAAGGTCTAGSAYNAGASCTVAATFSPTLPGPRYGGIVLTDSDGNVITDGYLQGSGTGALINFLPNVESVVPSSPLNIPYAVAVDAGNDIYIADSQNNRIIEEVYNAGNYTEVTIPTSPLNGPEGVTVDGAGNIYVVDSQNNRVLKEAPIAGGYSESTIPTSPLSTPQGIAVDGNGDVYIADSGNNRVIEEMLTSGSYTESIIPTSYLNGPEGVAVDSNDDVYIADTGDSRVLQEVATDGSYSENVIPFSGLYDPVDVAVDGVGNVYVLNGGNVLKETLTGGSYSQSIIGTSSLNWPQGLTVDTRDNVYVADSFNNRVLKEDFADSPALSFQAAAVGSTSIDSPQVVTIEDVGNAPLLFPVPSTGSNPALPIDFSLTSSGSSVCPVVPAGGSSGAALSPMEQCTLPISFAPTESGSFSESVALTDNSATASGAAYTVQSISLEGETPGNSAQTISFASMPEQTAQSTLSLTASASSGLPILFESSTPSVCTVSGATASFGIPGTCTIEAYQAGNSTFAPAAPVVQSFAVGPAPQTIGFWSNGPEVANASVAVPLWGSASSNLPVSYASSTPQICSVSNGAATFAAVGMCTITATQPGNNVYAAAPPVSVCIQVVGAIADSAVQVPSVAVGSSGQPIAVTVTIQAASTLNSSQVLTGGVSGLDFVDAGNDTCQAGTSYNSGSTCIVNVTFTPEAAGIRDGAIVLQDASGNVLATTYLQGVGTAPQVTFAPGTEHIVPTSALNSPEGLAVDDSGSIYIADSGNNRVLKETLVSGSYTESTVPTSALFPSSVALDPAGNLFLYSAGNNQVLEETPFATGYIESVLGGGVYPTGIAVDGSGNVYLALITNVYAGPSSSPWTNVVPTSVLNNPNAIAVDGRGDVYIADSGNNRIVEEVNSAGSYTEVAIPTSQLNYPTGIAVDSAGDIYISDTGNNRVLKETASGSGYSESVVVTSALNAPMSLALDSRGNLYITDSDNNRVLMEDFADPPTLTFAATGVGSTSADSPRIVTLFNGGNTALTLPVPATGTNPSLPQDFSVQSGGANACSVISADASSGGTLSGGSFCTLSISFVPTTTGNLSESVSVTDNTLNAANTVQSITLIGTGEPVAQVPVLSPGAGTYSGTQTVTITDSTPNATIYYTTDGSTPTTSSLVYSGPFSVSASATVEAIAAASGYAPSAVTTVTYVIQQ